jgi:hypothetical protein
MTPRKRLKIFDAKVAKISFRGVNDPAETEIFFQNAQTFFCLKYRYSMGYLPMKHFCWMFSLKKNLRTRKDDFKFPRGHMFPQGSLTLGKSDMKIFRRFPGVIDPAEILHENF